jgi:hypothetical protein
MQHPAGILICFGSSLHPPWVFLIVGSWDGWTYAPWTSAASSAPYALSAGCCREPGESPFQKWCPEVPSFGKCGKGPKKLMERGEGPWIVAWCVPTCVLWRHACASLLRGMVSLKLISCTGFSSMCWAIGRPGNYKPLPALPFLMSIAISPFQCWENDIKNIYRSNTGFLNGFWLSLEGIDCILWHC